MTNLLEITGDDIERLDDAELRTLVGLLCEADYRQAKLPTKGITWGGNQDARDGGLDVVVRAEVKPPAASFVPRKISAFQIKKPDMPSAAITEEMRPKGVLRDEIKALIQESGAYIIVSSTGSTTETSLKKRIKAMKDAIADVENHQNIHLDFLDRGRIATWVRLHTSLMIWVRNKIGKSLNGWRPYENWAYAPGGVEEEYILDEGLRLHDGYNSTEEGLSVKAGLNKLRTALSTPGTSVRLTGLSGVGKTRLVQALFDQRVGEQALNPSHALYTDISDEPTPDPVTLANQLINESARIILIVDNSPPDLHHRLTQVCSKPHSTISLLTVEYDVRDDLPEETSVYRLEPASEEIIEKLIEKRFSHISQVDIRTIADFSGGNARVAIALANTVQRGEALSRLNNEELFKRLFWQRNEPNSSILQSAEVCSLVYSFEGVDVNSDKSELKFLASLINRSAVELYRDVSELKKRDLVQSRGKMRAILPHAIANRLAKNALEAIPKDVIEQGFINNGNDRLIRSFTRRLGFLHDSETALALVNGWLNQDGWLGKSIHELDDFGIEILRNIAPVSPEKLLEAIERAYKAHGDKFTSRENPHHSVFVRLLRQLAYDSTLFSRSVALLCCFALSEKTEEKNNSSRDILKSLFFIHYSCTHAPVKERAAVIEEVVNSPHGDRQILGLLLLDAALETWYFSAHANNFGARSRDYGYFPKTPEEITQWFDTFIGICMRLSLSGKPVALPARKLLADKLPGLWKNGGMYDAIEEAARNIHGQSSWNDGWIAVRGILRYHGKDFNESIGERLHRLEKLLKPVDLLEQARTFALSDQNRSFDLEDDFEDRDYVSGWHRVEETTRKIGAEVAQNAAVLNTLLPDLVSQNCRRLIVFGSGLAAGSNDKQATFILLRDAFKATPQEIRQIGVISGFLSACVEYDSSFYNTTLDALINDDVFGEWFPVLQIMTATIDMRGVERLHKALELRRASIYTYRYLAWRHDTLSDDELARLLEKICLHENGINVAVSILESRLFRQDKDIIKYRYKRLGIPICGIVIPWNTEKSLKG